MASAPTAHVPPQNIEAEESVLGAMLVAEATLTRVINEVKLNASDFYLEKHATIFTCVHDLYAASKPVDELSVSEALTQRNQIEEAGGKHYVSELAGRCLPPATPSTTPRSSSRTRCCAACSAPASRSRA